MAKFTGLGKPAHASGFYGGGAIELWQLERWLTTGFDFARFPMARAENSEWGEVMPSLRLGLALSLMNRWAAARYFMPAALAGRGDRDGES